ncbi:MAG: hypothetical protein ACREI3_01185 [Nitrospirales bacterium]
MPYLFPYEDWFVAGVSVLILGLLAVRVHLVRRRNQAASSLDRETREKSGSHLDA